MKMDEVNELYKSEQGDKYALEELLPVVKRYSGASPKILEIGCGYGRNLLALSQVPGSQVTGCDISRAELDKADAKIKTYHLKNVAIVLQNSPGRLPFADGSFDFIVIWQVLEHVMSKKDKEILVHEAARVVKNGGHILIETPNFLFPIDHHDNNLPLVHWLLPDSWRHKITHAIRKEDFPPSQYATIFQINRFLKRSPHVKSFEQKTKIYFHERYREVFSELSGARTGFKTIFFILYAPFYILLRLLGLPGDIFTPSLRIVYKINKK